MANDFNGDEFWDGEEEEGYFEESRFPRVWLLSMGILSVVLVVGVVALAFFALFRPTLAPAPSPSPSEGPALSPVEGPALPLFTSVPSPGGGPGVGNTSTPVMAQGTPGLPSSTSAPIPAVPAEIAIGIYVKVSGTGGSDLSLRAGTSTNHARLKVVAEGAVLKVLDGPAEAEGYIWWKLEDVSDEMVGWAVADYLKPTVP